MSDLNNGYQQLVMRSRVCLQPTVFVLLLKYSDYALGSQRLGVLSRVSATSVRPMVRMMTSNIKISFSGRFYPN